jgi:hypothetical protein
MGSIGIDFVRPMLESTNRNGSVEIIVSDRDVQFTSAFSTTLGMPSAYHPQTDDGANPIITQMQRQCIRLNLKDWVSKPLSIQLAINSACSTSTSSFYSRVPRTFIWNSASTSEYAGVQNFVAARIEQVRDATPKWQAIPFKPGTWYT